MTVYKQNLPALLTGAALTLAGLALARFAAARVGPQRSFEPLLTSLEVGTVTVGTTLLDVPDAFKPTTSIERRDSAGRIFTLWVYTDDADALILYACDGRLFAAQSISGITRSAEQWYFADTALLDQYVELALFRQSPNTR